MTDNVRPYNFQNYLPEIFQNDNSLLSSFLKAPETLYEELEAAIEGTPGGVLKLTFKNIDNTIMVEEFESVFSFPIGTSVIVSRKPSTVLSQAIPARQAGLTKIAVRDISFVISLEKNDLIIVGDPLGNYLQLIFQPDITIVVETFESNSVGFPKGTCVSASKSSALKEAIPAYQTGMTRIEIEHDPFVAALEKGDIITVNTGGKPDEVLQLTFESLNETIIMLATSFSVPLEFPAGTTVSVSLKSLSTTLRQAIPANKNLNRIEVLDTSFVRALSNGDIISVNPAGISSKDLTVDSIPKNIITVTPFNSGSAELPVGSEVNVSKQTILVQSIEPDKKNLTEIVVRDHSFATFLNSGNILTIHAGGIPDLFSPTTCPPPQLIKEYREKNDFEYLRYLASWIALPLRTDIIRYEGETDEDYYSRMTEWNRMFFKTAIPHYKERSTIPGIEWLLRAWLKDDMVQTKLILTDLTRGHTDVDAIFQLGENATLGLDTVLGEGPPFFFIVDLVTNPLIRELRNPVWLDVFQRAARFLLDSEKPAHTYYQLRVRAHTMQLDPKDPLDRRTGDIYAQVGETTILWDGAWTYNSE